MRISVIGNKNKTSEHSEIEPRTMTLLNIIGVSGKGVGLWSLTFYPFSNLWKKMGEKGGVVFLQKKINQKQPIANL